MHDLFIFTWQFPHSGPCRTHCRSIVYTPIDCYGDLDGMKMHPFWSILLDDRFDAYIFLYLYTPAVVENINIGQIKVQGVSDKLIVLTV